MKRSFHLVATLPAGVFLLLHLLALVEPPALWGADGLVYYGWLMTAAFILIPLVALTIPVAVLPAPLRQLLARAFASSWFTWGLFLGGIPFFWLARVRAHTLGDSDKWFEIIRNAVEHLRPFSDIQWHNASLHVPGLEFINFQQALDVVIHAGVYWLLHALGGTEPKTAYEWVSIVAGGCYLVALWSLARRLSRSVAEHVAIFGFLASLGTLQLFCGYGESYTLVTLLSVLYLAIAIDTLHGHRPLWHAAAILMLATVTHMLAISLAPSFAILAWCNPRWRALLRRRKVQAPIVLLGLVGAVAAYALFYHGLQLPLVTPDAPGRYPMLSLRHASTLGNTLLLTGPFGLVWGLVALFRSRPSFPVRRFLGVAAGGAALLIAMHDITMGGRDWDLMSFPALMLAVWGVVCLQSLQAGDTARTLGRVILPVMILHTALWIGVNASQQRSVSRLEQLLLGDTNQATHYRLWVLGYYYMTQDGDDRDAEAADAFAKAMSRAPAEELNTPDTRAFSYRKYYANALAALGRDAEAVGVIRDVYQRQRQPYIDDDDIILHTTWAHSAHNLAEVAAIRGDSVAARRHWRSARLALERLANWQDSVEIHHDLGVVLHSLGHHELAIAEYYLGIESGQDVVGAMLSLGDGYLSTDRAGLAAIAYGSPLQPRPWPGDRPLDAEHCLHIGNRLHRAGDDDRAIVAFRKALARDPDAGQAHHNLGWVLVRTGDSGAAIVHLQQAVRIHASLETLSALGLAYLMDGQIDLADATYARAVDEFGLAAVGASASGNLDWLIEMGVQTEKGAAIRDRYWPKP
jgi:tetratricopeptide (TPR) repeat protein